MLVKEHIIITNFEKKNLGDYFTIWLINFTPLILIQIEFIHLK